MTIWQLYGWIHQIASMEMHPGFNYVNTQNKYVTYYNNRNYVPTLQKLRGCSNPTMGHLSCIFRAFHNSQCSECCYLDLVTKFPVIYQKDDMVPLLWPQTEAKGKVS